MARARTLVVVGDSLSAQLYYSFVLLLGDAVVSLVEHPDGLRRSRAASSGSDGGAAASDETPPPPPPRCSTGIADEGLSAYSEARLSRGGRVVKVLGHMRYIGELQSINQGAQKVCLKNIKCYGTEGRETETGDDPMPELAEIIEFKEFNGNMLKSLNIIRPEESSQQENQQEK